MLNFHKPDWLYEALPYVYILAGTATILNLGNTLSLFSGGLLISAGLFIWWMRRTARQDQRRRDEDRRTTGRRTADRRVTDLKTAERTDADRRAALRRETERRGSERRRSS